MQPGLVSATLNYLMNRGKATRVRTTRLDGKAGGSWKWAMIEGIVDPLQVVSGKRGFAAMTAERQREIAQMGGRAAQKTGKVPLWTSETARKAGIKGIQARTEAWKRFKQEASIGGSR
jgi:hypothetical protein